MGGMACFGVFAIISTRDQPTKVFRVPADWQNEPVLRGGFRPIPDPAVQYHPRGYTP
jgi:hypothetical protein